MRRRRTSGFSFVELLFAITVLGVGFIMLAAIFPVGLRQTKLTLDETVSAANARSMAARLQQIGQATVLYNTTSAVEFSVLANTFEPRGIAGAAGTKYSGQVRTLNDPRDFVTANPADENTPLRRYNAWQSMASDLISPSNSRNGTVVMYKRDAHGLAGGTFTPATSAQVIVVNTQNVIRTEYTPDDVTGQKPTGAVTNTTTTARPIFNLEARPVGVQMVYDADSQNYVASFFSVMQFDKGSGGTVDHVRGGYPAAMAPVMNAVVNALVEGTFVIISDDRIVAPPAAVGRLNGRIFKLGARRGDLAGVTFDLAPGYGFTTEPGADNVINDGAASPPVVSTDDLVGVGVDKDTTTILSGLGFDAKKPFGNNGPNGSAVEIAGSDGKKGAVALVIGRGFTNALTPSGMAASKYDGAAMDVSAYTTFVSVPKP